MKLRNRLGLLLAALTLTALYCLALPTEAQAATVDDLEYEYSSYRGGIVITDCDTSATGDLVIPESIDGYPVTCIDSYAFSYCRGLTSVVIPDSVTLVLNNAFIYCEAMSSVSIGNGVTHIQTKTFWACYSLSSVDIGDSVTQIGQDAFRGCTSLTSINIPASVTWITDGAFSNCTKLATYCVDENNAVYSSDEFGVLYNKDKSELIQAPRGFLGNHTIPDSVISIKANAFASCAELTSVIIPTSVTSIGSGAFSKCASLNHVFYEGSLEQWNAISVEDANSELTSVLFFHCGSEAMPYWTKNCVNAGLFCGECNDFIEKVNEEDGYHSYTDGNDLSCNDCDYIRTVARIAVHQQPSVLEYEFGSSILDVTDGVLMVTYSDGTTSKVEMTLEMVSGFDNTKAGTQTLTVSHAGKTTEYVVEIVPGKPLFVSIKTLPDKLYYIVGETLDVTGLVVEAHYLGNLIWEVPLEEVFVGSVDMTTTGCKHASIGFHSVYAVFEVYVHEMQTVVIDSSFYPESEHNYSGDTDTIEFFEWSGADSLTLTFSSDSYTENNADYVYLYDKNSDLIGQYSGSQLTDLTITINGDGFFIRLTSDSSVHKYGYAFASIIAESVLHDYKLGECTICQRGEYPVAIIQAENVVISGDSVESVYVDCAENQYVKIYKDTQVDIILYSDLYIDLNGYDLSGTIETNGYQLYCMDSESEYDSCEKIGYFTCTNENGEEVVPVRHFKTHRSMIGDVHRYMAISTDSGYTFHRFYLGITKSSLKPDTVSIGYKAVFYGDEMVAAQLDSFGYSMQLDGFNAITRGKSADSFVSGQTVTLRINNYDAENYGETALCASVYMQLSDGTTIQSAAHTVTLREMVESVNASHTSYSDTQLAALESMIAGSPTMQSWTVDNLYKKETA